MAVQPARDKIEFNPDHRQRNSVCQPEAGRPEYFWAQLGQEKVLFGDKNERGGRRGDWTFLHQHRAITGRAIKNSTEIEGFRACHIREGAALVRYFAPLEEQLNQGIRLSESQGVDQLGRFHLELSLFKSLSFATISSTGPNAAIIHYSGDPNDCTFV